MTMIRIALRVILIISISTATSWIPEDPYKCFEHDHPPVDTSATFYDYCKDNHGNLYKPTKPEDPAQQHSCCECLEYKCTYFQKTKILYWMTSVSDQCCLACTNTVYKAGTTIDTTELEDDCKSIETQVCRKLPGHEKAKIESDFNYKACCNDNTGLQVLGTEVYQPSTCSQRTCFYDKYLPFSLWISKQVIPGCDCCLRNDPKTGKDYLVADGSTWVIDGKVFECCRGDIVMKTESSAPYSTTTQSSTTSSEELKAVLITGGRSKEDHNATAHSVEIFLPKFPNNKHCILPQLPAPYFEHTQDGGMICGGRETQNTCRQWNSDEGKFPFKLVHEFKPGRYNLVSWTPVSEKETFLIGGESIYKEEDSMNTSTIVKPGIFQGIPGFNLNSSITRACSIPDPDTDTVLITGGYYEKRDVDTVSVYNKTGFVKNLNGLYYSRSDHGCTSYIADNKRVFLVAGGYWTKETTEILETISGKWKLLKGAYLDLRRLGIVTVYNEVFAFGGKNSYGASSSIFKLDIKDGGLEGRWNNQSYHMSRPRYEFGISVVDFKYYSKACLG